jgi:hypothetical protein
MRLNSTSLKPAAVQPAFLRFAILRLRPLYSKVAERFDLKCPFGRSHFGGTMFPNQWTPKYRARSTSRSNNMSVDSALAAATLSSITS